MNFNRTNRQWGRVVPLQPLSTRLMVWCIAAAVLAVVAFLFFAQYARKETASGYLLPVAGTAKVFAPQPGTISAVSIMVKLQRRSALAPLAADALPERRATGANVPSRRPLFRQSSASASLKSPAIIAASACVIKC